MSNLRAALILNIEANERLLECVNGEHSDSSAEIVYSVNEALRIGRAALQEDEVAKDAAILQWVRYRLREVMPDITGVRPTEFLVGEIIRRASVICSSTMKGNTMASISPTVGRVVLFHPSVAAFPDAPPLAAIVAYVHSPGMLNIAYFDADGNAKSATSVPLIQEGDERPGCYYCEWMPYQKGQAAKTEALESQLAK